MGDPGINILDLNSLRIHIRKIFAARRDSTASDGIFRGIDGELAKFHVGDGHRRWRFTIHEPQSTESD